MRIKNDHFIKIHVPKQERLLRVARLYNVGVRS